MRTRSSMSDVLTLDRLRTVIEEIDRAGRAFPELYRVNLEDGHHVLARGRAGRIHLPQTVFHRSGVVRLMKSPNDETKVDDDAL